MAVEPVDLEFWRAGGPLTHMPPPFAAQLEEEGWDGHFSMDSQSLAGDPYAILGAAAALTSTLRLGTGVTNPRTRQLTVTAAAIATVHAQSNGRALLGIGRGDSALAFIGERPVPLAAFEHSLVVLQRLLRGEEVPFDELRAGAIDSTRHRGRAPATGEAPDGAALRWLPPDLQKVPVEVAATGPRVIRLAARWGDRVMLSLGADERRLGQAVGLALQERAETGRGHEPFGLGAQVIVIPHPDADRARQLARPMVASLARFAVLDALPAAGDDVVELERIRREYDMNRHARADKLRDDALGDEFVDRFAVVGPPDRCTERLLRLVELGIRNFHVVGAVFDEEMENLTRSMLTREVLPAVRHAAGGLVEPAADDPHPHPPSRSPGGDSA